MNPENNAFKRTYFIGGPPRVGKTILAYKLAERISGHVVSTDAIRSAVKKSYKEEVGDLFLIDNYVNYSESDWLDRFLLYPEKIIEDQNKESKAFWNSIISFCRVFCGDNNNHIVEGVALLPSLVAGMECKPDHVFFIGNTNEKHFESMLYFNKEFPEQDWMSAVNYSEDKIYGVANFVRCMSFYFKTEAMKYGFKYYDIDDNDFNGSIDRIITEVVGV